MSSVTRFVAATGASLVLLLLGAVSGVAAEGPSAGDGVVDAGGVATMQPLTIAVSLPSEAHETPRSWLFMIETLDGTAVEAISVETSAEAPSSSAETSPLATGIYRVRILFGNHIGVSCGDGVFYQVLLPSGGSRTITIGASPSLTLFTFAQCPDAPSGLEVSVDADAGDAAPGDSGAPVVSVATFDDPLPPDTGSGLRPTTPQGSRSLTAISVLLLAFAFGGFGAKTLLARNRR